MLSSGWFESTSLRSPSASQLLRFFLSHSSSICSLPICWNSSACLAWLLALSLHSGLWVRRLLIGGSPFQARCPASDFNDGCCLEKPIHSRRRGSMIDGRKLPDCSLGMLRLMSPAWVVSRRAGSHCGSRGGRRCSRGVQRRARRQPPAR